MTPATHSCGDGDSVLCKLMSLFHHSGRKVANDAHLVHVSGTVDLTENGNSTALSLWSSIETNNVHCVLQRNIYGGKKKQSNLKRVRHSYVCPFESVLWWSLYTYTSWPEGSAALLWYKLRIHVNHLALPDVDESAVRSYEVIQGCGRRENIWVTKTKHDHEGTVR